MSNPYSIGSSARRRRAALMGALLTAAMAAACTQETQNRIQRSIQNWTGTNGVLEVYAGDKVLRRFLAIDKMSTALGTQDGQPRPYRYGYGVLDENLNGVVDAGEKRVYFEISDFATNYLFFESPR
jgi:opacity protein-like surface antigen